ncbi:MAG: hypothetical protein II748_07385 [Clostridia bacterium]|nr:hypothetical protein [Clostridia bacterium]
MADFIPVAEGEFKGKDDLNVCYVDRREDAQYLNGEWKFAFFDDIPSKRPSLRNLKYKATLPSSMYMNMYEAGLLPHPYVDSNSRLYNKLDEKVWYYGRKFYADGSKKGKKAYLCADGVAYYCKVWINGEPVVCHEGMFAGPNAEITDFIRFGEENEIVVEVLAANYGTKETRSFWNNEGINREIVPWNIMHDSATSNGDFTIVGIWNDIRIEYLDKYHIARPYFTTKSVSKDGKNATVRLEAEICDGQAPELHEFYGKHASTFDLTPLGGLSAKYREDYVTVRVSIEDPKSGEEVFRSEEVVKLLDASSFVGNKYPESQFYERDIEIRDPKIWDPMSREKASVYKARVDLLHEGKVCDTQSLNLGIRTIAAEPAEGRKFRSSWNDWQFVINGKKEFIKGMNWTPIDFLYDISPEKYRMNLELIKNQGVNMVRVWSGGGMPETEAFYDTCDELGLMVWQDHFPANTVSTKGWPMDVLESQEALNIYRMRKHPSLALHCGGNEINPYTEGNAMAILTVARLAKLLDPARIFHQAALDMGSAHVYNDMEPVWFGKLFKDLPFLGESGIHSFPSIETLREVVTGKILSEKLDLSSPENLGADPGLLNHFSEFIPSRVPRMLSRASQLTDLKNTTVEKISLATQFASAEYYTFMLQAMRSNYPVTTGAFPWVYKRPWPTIGVQISDGYGRPLIQYYAVQNAFSDNAVMMELSQVTFGPCERLEYKAQVIKNSIKNIPSGAVLKVMIFSPKLEKVYEKEEKWHENMLLSGDFDIPEDFTDKFFFALVELEKGGRAISQCLYTPKVISAFASKKARDEFRSGPKENLYFDKSPWMIDQLLNSPKASLRKRTEVTEDSGEVEISVKNVSDVPAIFTKISYDDPDYIFALDKNYFTLLPGQSIRVKGKPVRKGKRKMRTDKFSAKALNS